VKTVVGVFRTREEAIKAANLLQSVGFEGQNVIVLSPGTPEGRVESAVPTEDAEQPGMGKAIGSVVGGAVGLGAGAIVGSLLLKIEAGRRALEKAGAESLDGARERWWIGLRDAEETEYSEPEKFKQVESTYRQGFCAALEPDARGRSFEDAAGYLKQNYPDCYSEDSFRRGFERGQDYYRDLPRREEAHR
jgi:hypothetical protein